MLLPRRLPASRRPFQNLLRTPRPTVSHFPCSRITRPLACHCRRYSSWDSNTQGSGTHPTNPPRPSPPELTSKHDLPTLPCFSVQGKTVVITGGARGLGLVMARGLVASGADVALVDLDYEEAQKAAKGLHEWTASVNPHLPPATISAHPCDVTSPASISTCLDSILAAHPRSPTTLITAAGFTHTIPALEYPPVKLDSLLATNISGSFNWAVTFAKHAISASGEKNERKGDTSVILIGSMSASIVNTPQKQTPYNMSKAAVRHMAASLAVEWAELGIRVNCLSPGYMATKLTDEILAKDPALKKHWVERIPLGHMGDPADLVAAVIWLAGNGSRYVTGAEIKIDGGYTVL